MPRGNKQGPLRRLGWIPQIAVSCGLATRAVESVSVFSSGGGLFRRAIRVSLPLDRESAAVAPRAERLSRIRQ